MHLKPTRQIRSSRSRSGAASMRVPTDLLSRRVAVHSALLAVVSLPNVVTPPAYAAELVFENGPPGFQYADAKLGSGVPFKNGASIAIDYVMSTSGARYGAKIDSTKDRQEPYRWTLGDGSTIKGLELAILGGENVPPMLPGGVRRIIVPSELAYADLARPNKNNLQVQDCSTGAGPIPPNVPGREGDMGAGEFQRFKNIYCNANRPYQPDLVLDIKLFGKRTAE